VIRSNKLKKTPKQARAKARVETILNVTNRLVQASMQEGQPEPDSISTTLIAKEAGLPVGSIYQYFTDKNDILMQLYKTSYNEVEAGIHETLVTLDETASFEKIVDSLLQSFWRSAKAHPTFCALTRWANRQGSIWDVTPGAHSGVTNIVAKGLLLANIDISSEQYDAVVRTSATTISVLVDMAIEEKDEHAAGKLINELSVLISAYLGVYKTAG